MPFITEDGSDYIPMLSYERLVLTRLDTNDMITFKQDTPLVDEAIEALLNAGVDCDVEVVTLQ